MKKIFSFVFLFLLLSAVTACDDVLDILDSGSSTTEDKTGPLDDFDGDGIVNQDDPDDDNDGVSDEDEIAAGTDPFSADGGGSDTGDETSQLRQSIIDLAKEQLGVEYSYGDESPEDGFDCSGLAYYCYGQNGITLPRTSRDQYAGGTQITLEESKPADIVAFYSPVSHVGILLNQEEFIHSPTTGEVVCIRSMAGYWTENLTGVARYIDDK